MKSLFIFLAILYSIQLNAQDSLLITKEELMGKLDPAKHPDFVLVKESYANRPNHYLRKECFEAYKRMYFAAKECGIDLTLKSTTRNFNYQKGIWEKKWNKPEYNDLTDVQKARKILMYSSMPGTSRHHWGTDIDLNDLNNSYFESGDGKKVYEWLQTHASEFGFFQTYTSMDSGRRGYQEEKWHWSYRPLSEVYLREYNRLVDYSDIKGFLGFNTAREMNIIEDYVNGIAR